MGHPRVSIPINLLFKQMPGFAETFEAASLFASVRIEPEIFAVGELDGYDIPEIERDDVGDDGVHFASGERDHLFFDVNVRVDGVSAMGLVFGGADLDSPQTLARVEDEVVAVGVSPGLGDAEAEADGLAHEGEFGEFSAAFGWVGVAEVGEASCSFIGGVPTSRQPRDVGRPGLSNFPILSQRARYGWGPREGWGVRFLRFFLHR